MSLKKNLSLFFLFISFYSCQQKSTIQELYDLDKKLIIESRILNEINEANIDKIQDEELAESIFKLSSNFQELANSITVMIINQSGGYILDQKTKNSILRDPNNKEAIKFVMFEKRNLETLFQEVDRYETELERLKEKHNFSIIQSLSKEIFEGKTKDEILEEYQNMDVISALISLDKIRLNEEIFLQQLINPLVK